MVFRNILKAAKIRDRKRYKKHRNNHNKPNNLRFLKKKRNLKLKMSNNMGIMNLTNLSKKPKNIKTKDNDLIINSFFEIFKIQDFGKIEK